MKALYTSIIALVFVALFSSNAYAQSPATMVHCKETTQTFTLTDTSVIESKDYGYILIGQTQPLQTVMLFTNSHKAYAAWAHHTGQTMTVTATIEEHNSYCTYAEAALVSFSWSAQQ